MKINIRGGGGPMVSEYECPVHGRFEATVARDANGDPPSEMPCVEEDTEFGADNYCGVTSPWVISAPLGRVALAGFSRGKAEAPPTKNALTTRDLADGMPYSEWKAKRDKQRLDQRYAKNREMRK